MRKKKFWNFHLSLQFFARKVHSRRGMLATDRPIHRARSHQSFSSDKWISRAHCYLVAVPCESYRSASFPSKRKKIENNRIQNNWLNNYYIKTVWQRNDADVLVGNPYLVVIGFSTTPSTCGPDVLVKYQK